MFGEVEGKSGQTISEPSDMSHKTLSWTILHVQSKCHNPPATGGGNKDGAAHHSTAILALCSSHQKPESTLQS